MSIYQRYFSKSLIFFSSILVIFFLFIESNIGFKCFFNFANHFFCEFKAEEISGNWRDFRLKNIQYENSLVSIKANSIHIVLDVKSLFNISTIFKNIETNNLIILLKKENTSSRSTAQKISNNTIKKNIFIKYPIIFQKIHADKILLKTSNTSIFLSNVFTSIKLIKNNIIFFPTYIQTIHLALSNVNLKKNFEANNSFNINSIYHMTKKNNFLYFLSTRSDIFIPFNIHFILVKCKSLNLLNDKMDNSFTAELKAKIENNIFKIDVMKIRSNFLSIKSHGEIIFNHKTIICNIKNELSIPKLYNKIINFSFSSYLNNKFIFKLKFDNFYKINIYSSVFLNDLNHPFQIFLTSNNLFFPVTKTLMLEIKKFQAIIKGQENNYSLSLKQILSVTGIPSVFVDINGHGNLKNISFKKIKFFLLEKKTSNEKKVNLEKNIILNPSVLKFIGKINLIGQSKNNNYSLYIPKLRIDSNIVKKKISMLGSLSYKNFNVLESPGINLLLGNNKLYIKGFLGDKLNVYSSIYADDLNCFLPHLQGRIKVESNLYGNHMFPIITNKILGSNINWEDIYLKSIKIFMNIHTKNKILGNFLFDVKKAQFFNFHVHSLHVQAHLAKKNQRFHFLLKSPLLYLNIILNGMIDNETGNWNGFLKKINIQTIWGKLIAKKIPFFYYNDSNNTINDLYTKKMKIVSFFSNFMKNTKKSIFHILNESSINFKSQLFVKTKLKWILGKNIAYAKLLLTGNNIELKRKNKEKIFFENIDNLNLSLNFKKNNFKSTWMIKKSIDLLKKQNIFGKLNILDINDQQNISGKCIITNFPISFVNFFTKNFKEAKGIFNGDIKFFGSLYQPQISANIGLKNIFIKSDNLLKYLTLFFPYFLGKTDNIKINQEIIMKKGDLSFTLNKFERKLKHIQWNLLFHSKKIEIVVLPKIKIKFSSQFNLHYLLGKYDLIGYIKFSFFYFKINEKNFVI